EILAEIRGSHPEAHSISYIYLLDDGKTLLGIVDLRDIVLAADTVLLGDLMVSPVVSALSDDKRRDLEEHRGSSRRQKIAAIRCASTLSRRRTNIGHMVKTLKDLTAQKVLAFAIQSEEE